MLSIHAVKACPALTRPFQDLDKYENIFIGEVVGVHLTEYQHEMIKGLREDENYRFWSDSTLEHTVTVLPQRLKKGRASEVETLTISGCGVPIPSLRMKGLFFVQKDGRTHVLYQTDYFGYEDYLEKVGTYYLSKKQQLTIQRGAKENID